MHNLCVSAIFKWWISELTQEISSAVSAAHIKAVPRNFSEPDTAEPDTAEPDTAEPDIAEPDTSGQAAPSLNQWDTERFSGQAAPSLTQWVTQRMPVNHGYSIWFKNLQLQETKQIKTQKTVQILIVCSKLATILMSLTLREERL